jgi:hypothetical protein
VLTNHRLFGVVIDALHSNPDILHAPASQLQLKSYFQTVRNNTNNRGNKPKLLIS